MRSNLLFTLIILLLGMLPLSGLSQHPAEQTVDHFFQAVNKSDAAGMAAALSDRVILYYANGDMDQYAQNVVDHWDLVLFKQGLEQMQVQTVELLELDDRHVLWIGKGKERWIPNSSNVVFETDNLELFCLLKRINDQWKILRLASFYRAVECTYTKQSPINPKSDMRALKMADGMIAKTNFQYIQEDSASYVHSLSEAFTAYTREGFVVSGREDNQLHFEKSIQTYTYSTVAQPTDALLLSNDLIYVMGVQQSNLTRREDGTVVPTQPAEFMSIIRREDNRWKYLRSVSFYRGMIADFALARKMITHRWVSALQENNIRELANVYTNDIVAMNANGSHQVGKIAVMESLEDLLTHNDVAVAVTNVDALRISSDDMVLLDDYQLTTIDKKTARKTSFTGERFSLVKHINGQWQIRRVIDMHRHATPLPYPVIADHIPVHNGSKAMAVAMAMASEMANQYTRGMKDIRHWAADAVVFNLAGNTITPDMAVDYYKRLFAENDIALAARPLEASIICPETLYVYGVVRTAIMERKSKEAESMPPAEYVQILKKEEGQWKIWRHYTFQRGNKSTKGGEAQVSGQ